MRHGGFSRRGHLLASALGLALTAPAAAWAQSATNGVYGPVDPAAEATRVSLAPAWEPPIQLAQAGKPSASPTNPATSGGSAVRVAPNNPNAADAGPSTEQIVVTGSRVKRTALESTSPVVTVSSTDITDKGLTDTAQVLNQLPQIGVAGASNFDTNFSDDGAGLELIDIRNLGVQRTLVLVDGRRSVGGAPPDSGTNGFDVSVIPAYLVDHIDVLTGGGSAAYGSEADAGVVNIVLKKHYDGIMFNQQYGLSQYGDSKTTTTDFLAGTTFAHGDGDLLFALEYQDQGAIYSKDRDFSAYDIRNGNYSPSTFGVNGEFLTNNGLVTTLPNGSTVPYDPLQYGFNREAFRTIQIPTTKLASYIKVNYDITPDLSFFSDLRFARTTATSFLEPIAVGFNSTIGFNGQTLQLPLNNIYVPASLAAQGIVSADGVNFADWRRRFLELGPRGGDTTRYNWSITSGFNGTLLDRFKWQAYYTYGEATSTEIIPNSGNVLNLQQELNNCNNFDPTLTAAGCVPINIFGKGSISQAAINYFKVARSYNDQVSEGDVLADISGPVVNLPYGAVQLDLGFEHRREDGYSQPDSLAAQGDTLDTSGPATRGGYAVTDFFAETNVPILKDLPFAKNLSVDAQYRHSDYSLKSVGSQESYSYGGAYSPTSDIKFRIENQVAIRAPDIAELYTGRTQSAVSVTDPCSGAGLASLPNPALAAANCLKFPGVIPGFTETAANQQSEISYQSGNPDLGAERARVLTYGAVLTPRFLPGFSATVDVFKYFIANAIQSIDLQTAANQCVLTLNPTFCSLVRRDTNPASPTYGLIRGVDAKVINVGAVREQGADITLSYEIPVTSIMHGWVPNVGTRGAVDISWNYEYLQYLNYVAAPKTAKVTQQGLFGAPRNRWNLDVLYRDEKLQLNYQLRYLGAQAYGISYVNGSGTTNGPNVSPTTYSDVQVRYQLTPRLAPYIGINNLFNNKPPLVDQAYDQTGAGVASGVTGTNTVPDVYDVVGRYFYFGIKVTL